MSLDFQRGLPGRVETTASIVLQLPSLLAPIPCVQEPGARREGQWLFPKAGGACVCLNEVLARSPVKAHLLVCPLGDVCPWTCAKIVQECKSFPAEICCLFTH